MVRIPVILNVDTGIDDAVAMILAAAHDSVDILAVTTSFGNKPVEVTTENTLRILELINLDVPIAMGLNNPLLSQMKTEFLGSAAHGDDGLGNKGSLLPYPTKKVSELGSVELMAERIENSSGGVIIISTCPLTNVATLLMAHPELKEKIGAIAFSGGAIHRGNVLPTVESNILADPEAAQIVLNSGIKTVMCTLEVTDEAYVTFEDRERLKLASTRPAAFIYEALKHYSDHYENLLLKDGSALHSIVPVVWLTNPQLIKEKEEYVSVDLNGFYTRGATLFDTLRLLKQQPNVTVVTDIDRTAMCRLIFDSLRRIG